MFLAGLNEKDRRLYAGYEALRFGHGGRIYIAKVLECSRNTVSQGARELSHLPKREIAPNLPDSRSRIRKQGGGRKPIEVSKPDLDSTFLKVLRNHTAGDPMDEKVRWTNLTLGEIVKALSMNYNIIVSKWVVRQLLKKHNYRRRKAQKKVTMKSEIKNRNEPFEKLGFLKAEYEATSNPIISLDTKKKENWGNFYRDGHLYTLEELQTYDHDYQSFAKGVIIPHSIYDLKLNVGYIQLGNSHDTSEFAGDSLRHWWYTYGCQNYPNATSILILCDGGVVEVIVLVITFSNQT